MKTIPTKSFGDLKPKKEKKDEIPMGVVWMDESEEAYKRTELTEEKLGDYGPFNRVEIKGGLTESAAYVPKSERLLAIYDMLTDKSFPRRGKGKSTKPKILDAIIVAALDLKLKLHEA